MPPTKNNNDNHLATPSNKKASSKKRSLSASGIHTNAFSMMMMSKHKSGRKLESLSSSSSSCFSSSHSARKPSQRRLNNNRVEFVECPAGCGRHLPNLDHKINRHLDVECSIMKAVGGKDKEAAGEEEKAVQKKTQENIMETTNHNLPPSEESIGISSANADEQQAKIETNKSAITAAASPQVPHLNPSQNSLDSNSSENTQTVNNGVTEGSSANAASTPLTLNYDGNSQPFATSSSTSLVSPEQQNTKANTDAEAAASKITTTTKNPVIPSTESTTTTTATTTPKNNAFAHMMQQSSKVFAANKKNTADTEAKPHFFSLEYVPERQEFILNLSNQQGLTWDPPSWSTTVQVKDKSREDLPRTVALNLSLTIRDYNGTNPQPPPALATAKAYPKFVQYPSRLSVPVLKSMLQKSIRRRRPLPAVRVAMELLDKSCGEILRRLPIVMLEDSTLHPDLPLVVWMMVAHSKGLFDLEPPKSPVLHQTLQAMKLRVLRIVYQMASCPYQDHCSYVSGSSSAVQDDEGIGTAATSTTTNNNALNNDHTPSISEPFVRLLQDKSSSSNNNNNSYPQQQQQQQQQVQARLMVWGMLVRAEYGGMACDVRMLKRFAQMWHERLLLRNDDTTTALPTVCSNNNVSSWSQVPYFVHQKGLEQSILRVPDTIRLERLCLTDICKEGIDFHCSNVVDVLLKNTSVVDACKAMMNDAKLSSLSLEDVLKRCIWKFSAGVNLRRPLLLLPTNIKGGVNIDNDNEEEKEHHLKKLWKEVLAPVVQAYQTQYLEERLKR